MRTAKSPAPPPAAGPRHRVRHRLDRRVAVFVVLTLVYAVYTALTVHHTWVPELDQRIYDLRLRRELVKRGVFSAVHDYVTLGQRGPSTLVFLPYFIWTAFRTRSRRPLVMLVVALLLLNISVGAVKLVIGRTGPNESADVHNVFAGGNIYPSGHVSNAVVLYGLIAMISLRHRRLFSVAAVWIAASVGVGTIMINTHWLSDVVGGWFAGGLVLLSLPWFVPPAERVVDRSLAQLRRWFQRRRGIVPEDGTRRPVENPPADDLWSTDNAPPATPNAASIPPQRIMTADRPLVRRACSDAGDAGQLDSTTP